MKCKTVLSLINDKIGLINKRLILALSIKSMKKLSNYIKALKFEYLKTFSGLRGAQFEQLKVATIQRIQALEGQLATARFMQQAKIKKEIHLLQAQVDEHNSKLIDQAGVVHQSAITITQRGKSDDFVISLMNILDRPPVEEVATLCIPVFRDAIVFYADNDHLASILHICFECATIENENGVQLSADLSTFVELEALLKKAGHQIE